MDPATAAPITLNQANPQSGLDPRALDGLQTCGSQCQKGHLLNPAPRIGFALDPFGDGKSSIRAGYGIFFEHGTADEANSGSLEASSPRVLDMTQNVPGSYANIGNGAAFPLNVTEIPASVTWAYVQQWSLSVQRQLPKNVLATVAYVGSKGTHLAAERQVNQLAPLAPANNPFGLHQPLFKSGTPFTGVGNKGDCAQNEGATLQPLGSYTLSTGTTVAPGDAGYTNMEAACSGSAQPGTGGYNDPNSLRQYAPGLGQVYFLQNAADSEYNALQMVVRKTAGAVVVGASYTYSHSFDDASDRSDATFVNSANIHTNRSSSNFDQSHLLHMNYIVPLKLIEFADSFFHAFDNEPDNAAGVGSGSFKDSQAARTLLGNWELSGITVFETGIPFTVVNNGSPQGIATLDNAGVANGQGLERWGPAL